MIRKPGDQPRRLPALQEALGDGLEEFFLLPGPFSRGPGKGSMRFKDKGWCFWGASLLLHLCMVYLISLMPPGQGLSLKRPGRNLFNVRILGLKGPKKIIERDVHTPAKREKNSTEEKTARVRTPVHPIPKRRKEAKVQRLKLSPTPSLSTHEGKKGLAHESHPLTPGPSMERKAIPAAWEPKGSGFQSNGGKGSEGTGGLIPPVPIQREKPPYPPLARKRGYQGRLILRLLVSREGKVAQIKVVQSSGYSILDRTAVKTVKGWRFIPAYKGKEAVPFWVEVPVVFNLKGKG